ncbi:PhnD/SsuA/transferrin family substrate-binding protein [Geomonas edaphica]|uniref:PhnD/SsuA/transferrin family substrate-binding protein n=1 Tax=Geomonas edaphica TaxID=2570226 RepID=UPI0010A919E2|nr:PhnD/SsuA/transferrin family substrate-binding protein [Geomonas edaphica]
MKRLAACCCLFLNLLLTAHVACAASQDTYTFAVVPYYSPEKIWTLFTPVVNYLSKTTGDKWQLQFYPNHAEFLNDICNGKISAAFTGPVPLARAYEACGARPLLVALAPNGKPVYHSVFVSSDQAIRNLRDLKGKRVGFFKGSTAAHVVPVRMLKDAGVYMADISPVFLGSQDKLVSALLTGDIAAAGIKEGLYQKVSREKLHVLSRSEPLPNFAVCALPTFPAKARERFVASLLKLKPLTNARDRAFVSHWDDEVKHGFVTPDRDFLVGVFRIRDMFKDAGNGIR